MKKQSQQIEISRQRGNHCQKISTVNVFVRTWWIVFHQLVTLLWSSILNLGSISVFENNRFNWMKSSFAYWLYFILTQMLKLTQRLKSLETWLKIIWEWPSETWKPIVALNKVLIVCFWISTFELLYQVRIWHFFLETHHLNVSHKIPFIWCKVTSKVIT